MWRYTYVYLYYSFHIFHEEQGDVRLIGGFLPSDGRIAIWYNNTWRAVCDSPSKEWSITESNVVCRQLGYDRALTPTRVPDFKQGDSFILPIQWSCLGDESNILECMTSDTSNECFAAGVVCIAAPGKLFVYQINFFC